MKFTLVIAALFATAAIAAPCGKRHNDAPPAEIKAPETETSNNGQGITQVGGVDNSDNRKTENTGTGALAGLGLGVLDNSNVDLNHLVGPINVLGSSTSTETKTTENKVEQKAKNNN